MANEKPFLDIPGLTYLWSQLKLKFAAKSHSHAAGDISSGTLNSSRLPTVPITKGGTGATSAADARTNLGITPANIGAATSGHTHDNATSSTAGLMSAADKSKLDGVASGANAYTHPSYTARTGKPTANAAPAFGGTFTVSQITSDASGHVTDATDRTVTIPSTEATTSAAGLMSSSDKTKLNGIATGATKTTVDSALSSSSTNPVQNKVVNSALAARLPLSGGTLTGALELKPYDNGYSKLFKNHSATADYGTVLQDTDKNGNAIKITLQASDGSFYFVDKDGNIYRVYGDHYLPTKVGQLTTDVNIKKTNVAYGSIFGQGENNALMRIQTIAGDDSNRRTLALFDNNYRPDVKHALRLYDEVGGVETIYNIYGEHNKPTAPDVGAAPAENSTNYPGCYKRTADGVTEWYNPPMVLGVEYRTTERWNGKVVYSMIVDCGKAPNTSLKKVSLPATVANATSIARWSGYIGYWGVCLPTTANGWDVAVNTTEVWITTDADRSVDDDRNRVYIWVHYTKD